LDLSVLPEIFALALLLGAYRPLVRRVGAHVKLWFLGWCYLLSHYFILFAIKPARASDPLPHFLSLITLEICGLLFLLAAGNARMRRIGYLFLAQLAIPLFAQSALYGLSPTHSPLRYVLLHRAANLLFLLPAVPLIFYREARRRHRAVIGIAFALLGLVTLPIAVTRPELVTAGALALLFFSVAYLYLSNTPRYSGGVFVAGFGLAGWGLSYPIGAAIEHFYPGLEMDRRLLEMPQYLAMAGSILTLLEEHLQRTERMATHDPLTDLPNRRRFEERFAEALEEAQEQKTTVACLVIDVDDFKTINDTMGHTAGDQLLTSLAVRLSWHISARDILARTGGDEFTAMLAGVTDEHHLRFIASAMMSAASVPVMVDGKPIDVRISVGIALSPDHADDIDGLLKAADEAMYRAKRRGGNKLVFAGDPLDAAEEQKSAANGGPAPVGRSTSAQILRMGAPRSRSH
jgi:diguanylate cyclase (GGDEF)-like protein